MFVSKGPCFLITQTRHTCGVPQVNKSTLADRENVAVLPGWREGSEPREMNKPPQPACKNQHLTHKGCTWWTHKHGDKYTHNMQRLTSSRTHTIWQWGSRKSNMSRLQKLSLRTPKRRAAKSLGMKREGFVPFYYTASNGFKELVWVCVKGWGNAEHITHMESGYMLGPVRLTWVWGDAFIHKILFYSQGGLDNFGSKLPPLRNSRVIGHYIC